MFTLTNFFGGFTFSLIVSFSFSGCFFGVSVFWGVDYFSIFSDGLIFSSEEPLEGWIGSDFDTIGYGVTDFSSGV